MNENRNGVKQRIRSSVVNIPVMIALKMQKGEDINNESIHTASKSRQILKHNKATR